MSERYSSELIILTGPHGAGKDSVEKELRQTRTDITRVTRHITRNPADNERDGVDYHFVSRDEFQDMVDDDAFLEYAEYPDVLSGTSHRAILAALRRSRYATMTTNFEDALALQGRLDAHNIDSKRFFISPVAQDVFLHNETGYIDMLWERMKRRARPDDRVANKLAKAALYRDMYLKNTDSFTYVYNPEGQLVTAVQSIVSHLV